MQRRGESLRGGAHPGQPRRRSSSRCGCLLLALFTPLLLGLAALVTLGAAYAGWRSGIDMARTNAKATVAAEINEQCQRARVDITAGNMSLARTRLDYLSALEATPACLDELASAATDLALPTPFPPTTSPSAAPPPATNAPTATASPTLIVASPTPEASGYDLDALLRQARDEMSRRDFQRAIDTLDAISAIDPSFERDTVRSLYFEALKAEATVMLRGGRLSEGILLAGRAEAYGALPDQLAGERNIAEMYLQAMRLKQISPGDAITLFSQIAYNYSSPNYMNVLGELQAAYVSYGDAFVFGGDHCNAQYQFQAALDLQPASSEILRGRARGKLERAEIACANATAVPLTQADASSDAQATSSGPAAIGVRP